MNSKTKMRLAELNLLDDCHKIDDGLSYVMADSWGYPMLLMFDETADFPKPIAFIKYNQKWVMCQIDPEEISIPNPFRQIILTIGTNPEEYLKS